MFDESGTHLGVQWSVTHLGGKKFKLQVGEKVQEYICAYEPVFGLDIHDTQQINLILDAMQGL